MNDSMPSFRTFTIYCRPRIAAFFTSIQIKSSSLCYRRTRKCRNHWNHRVLQAFIHYATFMAQTMQTFRIQYENLRLSRSRCFVVSSCLTDTLLTCTATWHFSKPHSTQYSDVPNKLILEIWYENCKLVLCQNFKVAICSIAAIVTEADYSRKTVAR